PVRRSRRWWRRSGRRAHPAEDDSHENADQTCANESSSSSDTERTCRRAGYSARPKDPARHWASDRLACGAEQAVLWHLERSFFVSFRFIGLFDLHSIALQKYGADHIAELILMRSRNVSARMVRERARNAQSDEAHRNSSPRADSDDKVRAMPAMPRMMQLP